MHGSILLSLFPFAETESEGQDPGADIESPDRTIMKMFDEWWQANLDSGKYGNRMLYMMFSEIYYSGMVVFQQEMLIKGKRGGCIVFGQIHSAYKIIFLGAKPESNMLRCAYYRLLTCVTFTPFS